MRLLERGKRRVWVSNMGAPPHEYGPPFLVRGALTPIATRVVDATGVRLDRSGLQLAVEAEVVAGLGIGKSSVFWVGREQPPDVGVDSPTHKARSLSMTGDGLFAVVELEGMDGYNPLGG